MLPPSTTLQTVRAPSDETHRLAQHAMLAMGGVGTVEALGCVFNDLDGPGILCQLLDYSAWIIAAVLYCRWLYRAYADVPLLCNQRDAHLRFKPSEAVASFFLPFVGLVRPYRVLVDLHRASDPRRDGEARTDTRDRWEKPFPARAWWALWLLAPLATSILDNASVFAQLRTLDVLTDPSALLSQESDGDGLTRLLAALIHLALAAVAIAVVRSVAERQREQLRRLALLHAADLTALAPRGPELVSEGR